MIAWKTQPPRRDFARLTALSLRAQIDSLTPLAVEELVRAAAKLPTHKLGSLVPQEVLTEHGVRRYLTECVRFRWTQVRHRSRNNAYAYYTKHEVGFNPHAVAEFFRTLTQEQAQARLLDLIMHELAHLLAYRFHGAPGHGRGWKAWARAAGFVPVGSWSNYKKLARALQLHGGRVRALAAASSETKEITMSTQTTYTEEQMHDMTVAEVRDAAQHMKPPVEMIDARREAGGKTPNKGHWVAAVLKAQAPPAPKKEKKPTAEPTGERVYRFAMVTNAKSGNQNRVLVNARGEVPESDQKRIGCEATVSSWTEIHGTMSQADAGRMYAAGEGKKVKRSAKGKGAA